jgi:hypothetical protein
MPAAQTSSTERCVYVRLLDEPVDVYRPTMGVLVAPMVFRLLPTPEYNRYEERWEFPPGSVVTCEVRELSGGPTVVAVALSDHKDKQ